MDQGRILYLSPYRDNKRRATIETAAYRNLFVTAIANSIFVAYAHPGSKTEELCRKALRWGKTVYALQSDFNANLFAMGGQVADVSRISRQTQHEKGMD